MGVYIDMEMPKEGSWVTLRVFPDGQCFLYSWCGNDFDFMEHLTAAPVPPHGRLIDADKALDGLAHNIGICSLDYLTSNEWAIVSWFRDAPTIIPASEEGE